MQIYLVGGAIRDQFLGLPIKERDWVVVGATPEKMLSLGYKPIGKEFPVFLHPKTKEEYALARTERKVGKGYKGFIFYADINVTLIQDLERRDLTINAIAQSNKGEMIDPFGGGRDLDQRILRHVSLAFAEDPVRILRTARFAAKLPDFTIHADTKKLMHDMVLAGEVDALVAERVWQELKRSLVEAAPERFWQVLDECGALSVLFPQFSLTQKSISALRVAVALSQSPNIRLAALWHELSSSDEKALCHRYKIPTQFKELLTLVINYLPSYEQFDSLNAKQIWQIFKSCDAMRRPERFDEFLLVCRACSSLSEPTLILQDMLKKIVLIDNEAFKNQGLTGLEFGEAIKASQLAIIQSCLD